MKTLIFSNIYVALAAGLLAQGSYRLFGVEPDTYALLTLVFFATLAVYNLDRLSGASVEDRVLESERHQWLKKRRRWSRGLFVLGGVGVVGSLPFFQPTTVATLVPLAVISLGYCVPLLLRRQKAKDRGSSRRFRLKEVPGMKTFFVAVVWAAATVLLPAIEAGLSILDPQVLLFFGERWLFVFALTLPFDVRDIERDRSAGIKTLAVMLGAQRTMAFSVGMMVVFSSVMTWRYATGGDIVHCAVALSGVVTTVALLYGWPDADRRDKRRGELYYAGWLDGMLLLQAAMLWAF